MAWKKFLKSLVIVALTLMLISPAYPWGDKGHEIIAYIGQAHLSEQAREKVKGILKKSTMAEASIWPDHQGRKIPDMNPFHYVNLPENATAYDFSRDCPEGNCVVQAIFWYQRAMVNKEAPLNVRRIALRYVIHLIGDVHQPLHAGYRKDKGGNDIPVIFQGRKMNLHQLWDSGVLESEGGSAAEIANRMNSRLTSDKIKAWETGSPSTWAFESFTYARSCAYKIPEDGKITEEYQKRAMPIMEQRVAQAGIRLAGVLNQAFK